MSREDIDTVRRAVEAFSRGRIDQVLEEFHPEAELRTALGTYHWHAGFKQWFEEANRALGGFRAEAEELIDAGDRVILVARAHGQGKQSGVVVQEQFGWVCEVRQGKIASLHSYPSKSEALEAVGLRH